VEFVISAGTKEDLMKLAVNDRGPNCGKDLLAKCPVVIDANFQLLQKVTSA
jgi:hypothetical protein